MKCFLDYCKHFWFVNAPIDVDDCMAVGAIPYDTAAGIKDVVAGFEVVIPQLVVTVWVIDLVRLLMSIGSDNVIEE